MQTEAEADFDADLTEFRNEDPISKAILGTEHEREIPPDEIVSINWKRRPFGAVSGNQKLSTQHWDKLSEWAKSIIIY